jgi:hypothetical protein
MVMSNYFSETDFERVSWHDNTLYGLSVLLGDITHGDWRSDLVFDIDYIVEWVCEPDQRCRFRVAPATLTFHHVTDLKMAINWGDSGYQTALYEVSIAQIKRSLIPNQKICLDRPYYRWTIQANAPKHGTIIFGASGFTQILRAEPLFLDEQKLPPSQRTPFFPPSV